MSDTKNNTEQKKEKPKRSLFRKIVNGFITFFVFIFVLFLILFGYSQTSSFRNLLRENLIEIVSSSTNNGKLYIGDIEGTFLTTLKVYDVALTDSVQTVAYIGKIEIQTSPLQLLLRKIYLRKILLSDIYVKVEEDKNGQLNFAKLFASDESVEEETDKDSGSPFPFRIQVNNFSVSNLNLSNKTYKYLQTDKLYETINSDDLVIENFNLFSRIYADLSKSEIRFILESLSFQPNFKNFTLENLKGSFFLTKDFASVEGLKLITKNTDFTINARVDSLDLLSGAELQQFEKYPVQLEVITPSFNFDDLSSFLDATNFLKGEPSLHLRVQGYFGDLNVEKLDVSFFDTNIKMSGHVKNLHTPEKLYMDVKINNSYVNYENVTKLLPALDLPDYKNIILSNFNAEYKGEATKFFAKIFGDVNKGKVDGSMFLDLTKDKLVYDANISTTNLNLFPFLGINTSINSNSKIKGIGTSPNELAANAKIKINKTIIDGYSIKDLDLSAIGELQKIIIDLKANAENAVIAGNGIFDFSDTSKTKYDVSAEVKKLDLARFTKMQKDSSDLNLSFSFVGEEFDLDEMKSKLTAKLEPSSFNDHLISQSQIDLIIDKRDSTRTISLESDFLDFNIDGQFSLKKAIDLMSYQSEMISRIVSDKIDELNLLKPDTLVTDFAAGLDSTISNEDISFNYSFYFKDFETVAKFLGLKKLDIAGEGSGVVTNNKNSFGITSDFNIDYFVNVFDTTVIYMSDLETQISFSRNNNINEFNNLFGSISFNTDRIYANKNFDDIAADIIFNQGKLYFNTGAKLDTNLSFQTDGIMYLRPEYNDITLENLDITYEKLDLYNEDVISVKFAGDSLRIDNFNLVSGSAFLALDGLMDENGYLNFILAFSDTSGKTLSKMLVQEGDRPINGHLKSTTKLRGTLNNPVFDSSLDFTDINIGQYKFGKIICELNYADTLLKTDLRFIDTSKSYINPSLKLFGSIPINLGFTNVDERFVNNKEMDIKLVTNEFIINTFGDVLPYIKNQMGILNANLSINGTTQNPTFSGQVYMDESYLTLRENNLDYNVSFHTVFNNEIITINDFMIKNTLMVANHGQMNGSGKVILSSEGLSEAEFVVKGDLTVLSNKSKEVMPNLYGDLFIGTDGDWVFTYLNGKSNFNGDLVVKKANLTFSAGQVAGTNLSESINYIFIEDTTKISKDDLMLRKLLERNSTKTNTVGTNTNSADFDYEMGVTIEDPVEIVFILSKAANQKLTVNAAGTMRFERTSGQQFIQGEFTVLSGSKLEFIKTFAAEGAIRFESDVTDPYLDIISTYQSDYFDVQDQTTKPVAVKLKLTGPLSNLGRNLTENTDNINVYVGQRNIQDNVPDTRLDVSDAFSFVLIGKFKNDLSADQRTELGNQINSEIGNVAGSFLGPVLTGFVNSAVGEVVNDIRLGQTQQATTFSISGRIKNVKYTFGGTTDVFQNVNQANVKIEYLFNPNFLMRFERKDPVLQTNSFEEKITELGLKYRFEF